MIIDSHQHFWNYEAEKDAWITDEMAVLRNDFQPDALQKILEEQNISGCIAVQADQSVEETYRLINWADEYDFIKGVVGWIDLKGSGLEMELGKLRIFEKLKGFRHILQAEEPEFMLDNRFVKGLSLLAKYGYSYDLLVLPRHLPATVKLVEQLPDLHFVLDHLAKPLIKEAKTEPWRTDLEKLAAFPNVSAKLSGLVTEGDWDNVRYEKLQTYLEIAMELFGPDRLMYGSDWPVMLLATGYDGWIKMVEQFLSKYPFDVKEKVLYQNAERVYKL